MQVIVWAGVIFFAIVLAYAEIVLAVALERALGLEREGSGQAEVGSSSPGKPLRVLLPLCFVFVMVLNLYLLKLLFWGG